MTDSELQVLNEALKTYRFRWQHARTLERELEQLEGVATEAEKKIIILDKYDSSTWLGKWKKWLVRMERKSLVQKLSDKRQKRVERIRVIRLLQKDYHSMESVRQDLIDKKKKYIKDNWEEDWQGLLLQEAQIEHTQKKIEGLENVEEIGFLVIAIWEHLSSWLLVNKTMFLEDKETGKLSVPTSKEDYQKYDELSSLLEQELLFYQRVIRGHALKISNLEKWIKAYLNNDWSFHWRLADYSNRRKYLELHKVLKKLKKMIEKVRLEAKKKKKQVEERVATQKITYYKLLEAEK